MRLHCSSSARFSLILLLAWVPVGRAGWLDTQLERAKQWTQFHRQEKGDYEQHGFQDRGPLHGLPNKNWIEVGGRYTVFHSEGTLFYAGGDASGDASLNSFKRVNGGPKVERIIASGKKSYALTESGDLYQWQGVSQSGELNALSLVGRCDGNADISNWTALERGIIGTSSEGSVLYSNRVGDDGCCAKIPLPVGIKSAGTSDGANVFLLNNGYLVRAGAEKGVHFNSSWGNSVSMQSTENATWILTEDGSVWRADASGSSQVSLDVSLTDIAAGRGHVLGLDNSGHVWSWGNNLKGQLGQGNLEDLEIPTQIKGLEDIVAIAAGHDQSFAVSSDGNIHAWGNNDSGQLGIPNAGKMQLAPHTVHVAGIRNLSLQKSHTQSPVRIYFPQTGAVVGAPLPL